MDEVLFRSSQKLENLQIQLSLAATHSKDLFQQYSQQGKSALIQAWHSPHLTNAKSHFKELWEYIISMSLRVQENLLSHLDPQKLYYNLVKVLYKKWTKRDLCFWGVGFVCGSIVGVAFMLSVKRKERVVSYMQAVQCTSYMGIESATVVENARAPDRCGDNEVVVSVKAAAVHGIDAQICSGYGKNLRGVLQKLYDKNSKSGLPLTLGRACAGIITDVGPHVKRLEPGDEVWLTAPFWCSGTLSQSVLAPDFRISRKPKNTGFEGAASLPYAGSIALSTLKRIAINQNNASDKKFLILGGCSPVGCVLIQLLTHWGATVATTCSKRAVPVATALGVDDVITEPTNDEVAEEESVNAFQKELELRDGFDFVIITRDCCLEVGELSWGGGKLISTLPPPLVSDSFGFFSGLVMGTYIRFKFLIEKLLGISLNDFDEAHLCHVTLDELADLVEDGHLQTVVDKVFHPEDIEMALMHIQSADSIGSTVITFR